MLNVTLDLDARASGEGSFRSMRRRSDADLFSWNRALAPMLVKILFDRAHCCLQLCDFYIVPVGLKIVSQTCGPFVIHSLWRLSQPVLTTLPERLDDIFAIVAAEICIIPACVEDRCLQAMPYCCAVQRQWLVVRVIHPG